MNAPGDEDDDEQVNPLDSAAAALPPIIGGGCLARFDPDTLNDMSGVEFPREYDPQ